MSMTVPEIDSIRPNDVLDKSTFRPEALSDLAARFEQAMQAQPYEAAHNPVNAPSAIAQVASKGEVAIQNLFDSVRGFSAQAPVMSMEEITSKTMQLTWELANVQFHFTACTSIAQSCKSGMQTLMKNQ
jgi:type III secretion inner rod protein HrpB2